MAIDAGTGSVRAVLFDLLGNQIAMEQREWVHLEEEGVANSMSFDYTKNWKLVKECIRLVINHSSVNAEDILALSATSMREGIILYDKNGNELWGVANVDARAADEVKELKEQFEGLEEEFYALSGQTFALGALPRLLWLKKNRPFIYEKVASMSMIGDWVLAKLSGSIVSDPSNGGTTGIFSLKKRDWVCEMASRVGLKESIFPKILEVGTPIGTVTAKASQETGLSTTTQVVMGGGDVQLGSAGLGVVKEGDVAILGGSFWQQVVNISADTETPRDMALRVNPHVVNGLSQAEGITFFSGLVMRWFRDAFCDLEKLQANEQGIDVYELLERKASKVPVGSYGILPIFSDVMNYGKWYHAAPSFINLNLDAKKCNKASMFRSLQENAAIVSSINLDKIKVFTGVNISEVVFAGGASKGKLWPQIVADVTGCRVKIPKVREATALGAAMAAGVGCGVYTNLEHAADLLVNWEKVYEPNLANTELYKSIKEKWQAVYKEQLLLVDRGLTQSMWSAPGL
ncbi:MAG: autoinducer-2 kinase [Campylobacterales bacterium]|nr:autoinducer-2 kinase [Campylobacterales bacterium]